MTLTEFLLARIAEDAAVAQSVPPYPHDAAVSDVATVRAHLRRWTALRVLAECEAKRQIVEQHEWLPGFRVHDRGECRTCGWASGESCPTVLHLATVYADHPDYRPEWKP